MDPKTGTDSLPRAQSKGIFIFIFSFIFAVFVSSFVPISIYLSVLGILIGIAILVLDKKVLFLSLAFISFGLGALHYSIKDFHKESTPTYHGVVVSEPEQKENSTRFVFKSDNGEKVLVSTDLYSPTQYGDKVKIDGKLKKPGIIVDEDSGRPFNYGKYLSKDDIYYTIGFAKVEIISNGHGNVLKAALFKIKDSFVSKIREIFTEPEASLLSGLIVAGKAAMPKDILEEFRRAGVIHIVVLSGYNITIIAEFMRKMFERVFLLTRLRARPRLVASISILSILLFVLMTGAEATVVRAAIMVLVVIAAKMFGRTYSAPRALLAAAFLMIVHNPKILVFDPSFQLSFLATCALIYIVPIFEKYLKFIPEKWDFRTVIVTTLATQVTVLPLLIYFMGNFSLVSLPSNVLVLLLVPATMLLGFLSTLVAFISPIIALPFSYATHLLLSWILSVSHYLGDLSFASIPIPTISIWLVALVYLVIITLVWRSHSSVQHSTN